MPGYRAVGRSWRHALCQSRFPAGNHLLNEGSVGQVAAKSDTSRRDGVILSLAVRCFRPKDSIDDQILPSRWDGSLLLHTPGSELPGYSLRDNTASPLCSPSFSPRPATRAFARRVA
jgi:hypothetical protein